MQNVQALGSSFCFPNLIEFYVLLLICIVHVKHVFFFFLQWIWVCFRFVFIISMPMKRYLWRGAQTLAALLSREEVVELLILHSYIDYQLPTLQTWSVKAPQRFNLSNMLYFTDMVNQWLALNLKGTEWSANHFKRFWPFMHCFCGRCDKRYL